LRSGTRRDREGLARAPAGFVDYSAGRRPQSGCGCGEGAGSGQRSCRGALHAGTLCPANPAPNLRRLSRYRLRFWRLRFFRRWQEYRLPLLLYPALALQFFRHWIPAVGANVVFPAFDLPWRTFLGLAAEVASDHVVASDCIIAPSAASVNL